MENSPSPRPIDILFTALHVRYGAAWTKKWEGIEIELVKQDWMRCLAGFSAGAVKHGLANLPDAPPNVEQFRRLCRQYVEYQGVRAVQWKPQPLPPEMAGKVSDFKEAMRRKALRAGLGGSTGEAA